MLWFYFTVFRLLVFGARKSYHYLTYFGAETGEIAFILFGTRSSYHFIRCSSITKIAFTSGILSSQNHLCSFELLWQVNTKTYQYYQKMLKQLFHAYQTLECSTSGRILKTTALCRKLKIGEYHATAYGFLRLWYKYELRKYSH